MNTSLSLARAIADVVLYEGYLLYPYRASSQKNQARWQFGILGPQGSAETGVGEDPVMSTDCLLRAGPQAHLQVHLRFLQLLTRTAELADGGSFTPVEELRVGNSRWLTWDEATEHEVLLGPFALAELAEGLSLPVQIPSGEDVELLTDESGIVAGRLVRRRRALRGVVRLATTPADGHAADGHAADGPSADPLLRLHVAAENVAAGGGFGKQESIASSFIGTHLLLSVQDADFVSLLEPPAEAQAAAAGCAHHRCWPVLAGPEGQRDILLLSPIILYDHPAVAPESSVALYDSTEIDEILTLRVLTLTEEEKAEARATDPRAAAVIDRCEAMSAEELQQLHGVLRSPHAMDGVAGGSGSTPVPPDADTSDLPWWDPASDSSVQPDADAVMIDGVPVARGSRVIVHPRRRADAQDLFSAGQAGRVTGVHFDVDGSTHVAVVLDVDPAADLQEWYGRFLYFAPEELEPIASAAGPDDRKETQS
ncbi:hypothetical protein V3C33_09270 [Micrococcaceae bacterium Sec5.7]